MATTFCEVCGSADVQWGKAPNLHLRCHGCGHEEKYAGVPEHQRPAEWQAANAPRRR